MIKRNTGERAETYFDSIDLQILEKLNYPKNINNSPEGLSVLELAETLKIKHKNLKPHIDKLLRLNLIFAYKDDKNKLRLMTGSANVEYTFGGDVSVITDNLKEQEEIRNSLREEETILKYLKKVRELKREEDLKKEIEIDLRKKEVSNDLSSLGYGLKIMNVKITGNKSPKSKFKGRS